jgi:polyhydroxyalkanoate synthesis regulator phasin
VRDALKSYLTLAGGLTEVTRQRAVAAARALAAQGEATAEQVTTLAEDLLQQSKSNREAVSALVKYEVERTLGRVGLASNDEVAELHRRVRSLEAQLRKLGATPGDGNGSADPGEANTSAAPAAAAPAKKAPAKKTPAKTAPAKAAAKKAPAKKAPARPASDTAAEAGE